MARDQQLMQGLAQKEDAYVAKVMKLDEQIIAVQRSTRTTIPALVPLHNYFRMKWRWYYQWHLWRYASLFHWVILSLTIAAGLYFGLLIGAHQAPVQVAFAASDYYQPDTPTEPATPDSLVAKDESKILQPKTGEKEIVGKRTETANSFTMPDGKIRVAASIGPINYKVNPDDPNEQFKQIDLTIDKTPDKPWQYAMEHNGYQARFWTARQIKGEDVKYVAQYRQNNQWLEMAPVVLQWENDRGETQEISKPRDAGDPVIDNTNYTITWTNVFGDGIDFRYNVGTERFFKTVIINNKESLPAATIDPAGLKLSVVMALDWSDQAQPAKDEIKYAAPVNLDNTVPTDTPAATVTNPDEFSYKSTANGKDLWWMQQPKGWDSTADQPQTFDLNQTITQVGDAVFADISMPADKVNDAKTVYPLYIDTTMSQQAVGASSDDAEYYPGNFSLTATNSRIGWFNNDQVNFQTPVRFSSVPIPAGATINTASITVRPYDSYDTIQPINIYGHKVSDSATFSTEGDYTGRTRTTATVAWTPSSWTTWIASDDISSVVSEVIATSGWANPSPISIFLQNGAYSGYHFVSIYTWDQHGDSTNAPKLDVTYTTGVSVSGTVYTAENKSTNIGTGKTIGLSVNGAAATTTTTDSNGAFTFTGVTAAAGNTIALYVSGDTSKASYITIATDGTTNISGLELYTSHIVLSQQNATAMTNALLATANTIANTDMLVSTSGSTSTFTSANTVRILATKNYTPGGTVTLDTLQLYGTFVPGSNTINISGNWDATGGTFTNTSSTITFNGTASGKTITSAGVAFNNVTINGSGGVWTMSDAATVAGTVTVSAGTLTLSAANTIAATVLNAGTININNNTALGTGTLTINGGTIDNTTGSLKTLTNNNTQTWGGSFAYGGGYDLNLGTGTITLGADVTITGNTSGNPLYVGGAISGAHSLTTAGAGIYLTLSGASTFAGPLAVAGNGIVTLSGSYSGSITVGGTNTLTISSANAMSGTSKTVTLNSGELRINNATALGDASNTLVINGGTLNCYVVGGVTVSNNNQQIWNASFIWGGTRALNLGTGAVTLGADVTVTTNGNVGSDLTVGGAISGAHVLTKAGTKVLALTGTNTYTGGTNVNAGTLSFANGSLGSSGNIVFGGGTLQYASGNTQDISARLKNSGSAMNIDTVANNVAYASVIDSSNTGGLTKIGSGTLTLSADNTFTGTTTFNAGLISASALAKLGSGTALTFAGGGLQFSAAFDPSTRTMTFNAGGATFDVQSYAVTFANAVGNSGAGSLTMTGTTGSLTLSAANTYTGGTVLNAGTLNLNHNTALGSGTFTIAGGTVGNSSAGTKTLTNNMVWNSSFALNGGQALVMNGTVALGADIVVTATNPSYNFGGVISGAYSLTMTGTGTLNISGNNTFSGGLTVLRGYLNINSATAVGTGTLTIGGGGYSPYVENGVGGTITLTNNNPIVINSSFTVDNIGSSTMDFGTGNVSLGANVTISAFSSGDVVVIGGVISGAYSVTKSGSGSLTLSGANTFGGAGKNVTLNAGTLNLNNATAIGDASNTLVINGGTIDNSTGGAITLSNNNPQTWGGSFAYSGTRDLNLGTGAVTLGANVTVTANGSSYALSAAGVISGAYSLTKAGTGYLLLSGANTYSGGTALNAGYLLVGNATAIGTGTLTFNGGTIDNSTGNTLTFSNNNAQTWNASFTFRGISNDLNLGTGAVNLAADVTVTTSGASAPTLTVGGAISGAHAMTKAGTAKLLLSGASSYSGTTTVSAGTLKAGAANVIPSTSAVNLSGGTLDLAGYSQSIGSLTGSSNFANTAAGAITLTVGNDNTSPATYSGVIGNGSGTVTLTKVGTGTLTLSGTNTFTGAVNMNGGLINASALAKLGSGTALNFGGGGLQFGAAFDPSSRTMTFNAGGATFDTNGYDVTLANAVGNGGSGSFTKLGTGTLTFGAAETIGGDLTIAGGTLTAPSTTLSVAGDWDDVGGSFTHNSGTIDFTKGGGTQQIVTGGSLTYNNITHSGAGTLQFANTGWYNGSWTYRKPITINHSVVSSSDQTNFPLAIYLGSDANLAANAQSNGNDILFTTANGVTKLSHEIEKYTTATGELEVWVKIPNLSAANDTVLYMYYGNAGATSQQAAASVWDSNYKGVWHMPNGSSLSLADSTGGTASPNSYGITAATGKIDGGSAANGTSGQNASWASTNFDSITSFTMSAWVNIASYPATNKSAVIVGKGSYLGAFWFENYPTGVTGWITAGSYQNVSLGTPTPGAWNYLTMTYDGPSHTLTGYLNGSNPTTNTSGTTLTTKNGMYINQAATGSGYFNGSLDELEMSNTARSASWIATQYNNQNNPASYQTLGDQATNTAQNFNSNVTLTGNLTNSTGTFVSTVGILNVGGNFANSAAFTHNSGTVALSGADASTQTLIGSTTFNNLSASTSANSAGRTIKFTDGTTQTVAGAFTITGAAGKLLTLQRTGSSSNYTINPTTPAITYAAISNLTNGGSSFCATHTTDGGGNSGFEIGVGDACSTVPDAPTIGTATRGNTEATVTFTPPGSDGGATITGYTVTSTPDSHTASGAGSPLTVTGLTNGTAYTFTVHATNSNGNSAESAASNSVTPATSPTVTTQAASNLAATAFTGNGTIVSTGGVNATIRGVQYAADGSVGHDCSSLGESTASYYTGDYGTGAYTRTTGGLATNSYYCAQAYATNPIGSGYGSWASFLTAAHTPGTPTVTAHAWNETAGDSLSVTIDANANAAAIEYAIACNVTPDSWLQGDGTCGASKVWKTKGNWETGTVNYLKNASPNSLYSLVVLARNVANVETPTSDSASRYSYPNVPTAPTVSPLATTTATVVINQNSNPAATTYAIYNATLSKYVKQSDGTLQDAADWQTYTTWGGAAGVVSTTLTANTQYAYQVKARNGDNAESDLSGQAATTTLPSAPMISAATRGNGTVSVSFTPGAGGGATITGYTVTSTPGSHTGTGAASPITVSGLTNGTPYTFTVHATNASGDSVESAASDAVTPATTPGAPTSAVATTGAGQMSVAFAAPVADGGDAIVSYTVTSTPGSIIASGPTSTIVVDGLSGNTAYTFTAHATNTVGDSAESTASAAQYTLANTPAVTTVASYDGSSGHHVLATINANGNAAGTYYWLQSSTDGITYADVVGMAWQTSLTYNLANLNANTRYWLKVKAKNGADVATGYSGASSAVTPPASPTALNVSNVCRTTASGSWVAAAGADTYTVSYGTNAEATNLGTVSSGATASYSFSNLTNHVPYYFKVAAVSTTSGAGPYSEPVTFTTDTCTAPIAPSDFAGTAVSASQIDWRWTDTADDEVNWQVKSAAHAPVSSALAAGVTAWSESDLTANTAYSRLTNVSNPHGANDSNIATVYTRANVPAAPTVTAQSQNSVKVVINQSANPDITQYAIFNQTLGRYVQSEDGSLSESADWQLYATWGGVGGVTNGGLVAGTTYSYQVKARNGADVETALSTAASVKTTDPSIQFTTSTATGSVTTATVVVSIVQSEISGTDTAVTYTASGGTAVADHDYTLVSGTAHITAGSTTTSFNLIITNDHLVGSNKTVIISLSNPADATLGSTMAYTYTIINDNQSPSGTFTITSASRTNLRTTSLALTYEGGTHVKAATAADFTGAEWQAVSATGTFELPAQDGIHTIYLKYKDAYGNESATDSHAVTLDQTAPFTPTAAAITAGNTAVTLTWTNPTAVDSTGVRIYRSETAGFTTGQATKTFDVASPGATYTDQAVSNNTTYYYLLASLDDLGNVSAPTAEMAGRPDNDNPTTPGKPTQTSQSNTKDAVFSWTASTDDNSGVKSYFMSIGTSSGGSEIANATELPGSISRYGYTFLADGTYFLRVSSIDNLGNRSATSEELTVLIDTTAPVGLADLFMTNVSDWADSLFVVLLSWQPATDAGAGLKGYVLYRDDQPVDLGQNGVTVNTYVDAKTGTVSYLDFLKAGVKSKYAVKAVDQVGNETAILNAKLADTTTTGLTGQTVGAAEIYLPETIIGEGQVVLSVIKAIVSSSSTDKTVAKITWRSTTPATSQVEYGLSESYGFKTDIDNGLNSSHTVILPDLKNSTAYHYKVSSVDKHGNVIQSADQTFTTGGQVKTRTLLETVADSISGFFNRLAQALSRLFSFGTPVQAAGQAAEVLGIHVANISTPGKPGYVIFWSTSLGQVRLERSEDGGAFIPVIVTEQALYIDHDVKADQSYTYRVGALTGSIKDELAGKSTISDIVIEPALIGKETASVTVSFKTDRLARSQIMYGENGVANQQTVLDEALNQSHTTLIENLKPNTAYVFILRAVDKTSAFTTDSSIQTYTTPPAPVDQSLLLIIVRALESALSGLGRIF